jgi:hypothetical protein
VGGGGGGRAFRSSGHEIIGNTGKKVITKLSFVNIINIPVTVKQCGANFYNECVTNICSEV